MVVTSVTDLGVVCRGEPAVGYKRSIQRRKLLSVNSSINDVDISLSSSSLVELSIKLNSAPQVLLGWASQSISLDSHAQGIVQIGAHPRDAGHVLRS